MKLLGHSWIALNSYAGGNQDQLILGSIAPEIAFYTSTHPFTYEEIHEGGNDVLDFVLKNEPEMVSFAIGMVSHSKKYGADRFNKDDKLAILGYQGKEKISLRKKIEKVMGVTPERSAVLAHNLLELAIELSLINKFTHLADQFNKAITNYELIDSAINVLASTFKKDPLVVKNCFEELLEKAKSTQIRNDYDLAVLWREMEPNDPEFKTQELAELLTDMNQDFASREWKFLEKCIAWTKNNILAILKETTS